MINLFVRSLAKQRQGKRVVKGVHTSAWRLPFQSEVELLERRIVLSHSHIYNINDEAPILDHSSSGSQTISVYEDQTGDGFTPDDVLLPISIPVTTSTSTLTAGEIFDGHWIQNDTYSSSESVHYIANGGTLYYSDQVTWDDLIGDGLFDSPGAIFDPPNPPRPSNDPTDGFGNIIHDHILYEHDSVDGVNLGQLFRAGQTWILTDDSFDATGERLTYVRQYTVRGRAYEDKNGNGHFDDGEPPIRANVYMDRNNDGIFQPEEYGTTNNADGTFEKTFKGRGTIGFGNLGGETYFTLTEGLHKYLAPNFDQADSVVSNLSFGYFQNMPVEGRVFDDVNGDGAFQFGSGEGTITGIPITVTQNGKTYSTTSGVDGYFAVYLGPGAYEVTQDLSYLGVRQTVPTPPGGYSGTITHSGQSGPFYLFGRTTGKDVLISAATRADAKGVDFTWQSTSGIGSFQVSIFESTDLVWDNFDLPLETPLTITPGAAGGTGSGRVTFTADHIHNPIRPYLIAVADPLKKIGETNEANNAFVVQRIFDLSPFKVTGDFTYDAPNDQFVSNGAAQVGFKPLTSEAFVPLVGGNITYNGDQIRISGTVTTNYGDLEIDLFDGNVTINVHSGGVSNLNVVSGVWELAGCKFAFDQFSLVNPAGGSALDSYLNVQGYLVTPGVIGAFKVQFTDPNFIHFGPQAHGISGTIQLEDAQFSLDSFLTLVANGASISYLSKTEANPEGALRLQGKFFVKNEGLETSDDTRPTLDISGPNYVEFGSNGVFFVGQFSIKNFCIIRGFLTAKSGSLFLDTVHHEWKLDGELVMKTLMDPTVILGAGMYDGDFNYIKAGVGGLDIPTFMAGIFLNKVSLAVDGLAGKKKNPQQELIPIEFTASIGLSEGPKIKIPDMPLIGVEARDAAIASLDITGTASSERVAGSVLFTYMDPKVLTVTGGFDWNWKKNEAKLSGGINGLNGSVTGAAAVTVNQRGVIGTASLIGVLRIPKGNGLFFAPIADISFRGYFQSLTSGSSYGAFAADVTLPVIGRKSITVKVSTAGGVEYFFGDMVSLQNLPAQPHAATSFATAFAEPQDQEASTGSDTFTVTPGTQQLLLSATWANELDDATLELVRPDGTILMESDLDGVTGAVIPEMTSTTSRAIALLNPMEGDWQIRVVSAGDPGEIQYAALRDGTDPTVEIDGAQVTSDGVSIQYTAADDYPDATATLFYDTDHTGFDGFAMTDAVPVTGAGSTFNWNFSQAYSGTFYIYAMVTDSQGNVTCQYLDTPITIDADPPASIVTVLPDLTDTTSFTLSWAGVDDPNGSGVASYDIYVAEDGGEYTQLLNDTTETTTQFTGQFGHTYSFYSVATDAWGHVEAAPTEADAQTDIEQPNQTPLLLDALFSLAENSALNTPVGTVAGTDADSGDTLTYSIIGGNGAGAFAIDPVTGAISVANPAPLDFETTPAFSLTVQVADNHGATDSATVTVNLTDVDESLHLTVGGSDANFTGKHDPVNVLPQVTVTGAVSLAGGTLTITDNSPGKKKPFDVLTPASASSIGTLGMAQFVNGHLTLQVQLNGNATTAGIQAFLRGLKFSTKGAGLKALTRTLGVTLSAGGQSSSISQTIRVQKKA